MQKNIHWHDTIALNLLMIAKPHYMSRLAQMLQVACMLTQVIGLFVARSNITKILHQVWQFQSWQIGLTIHISQLHYDVIKWEHFPRYWPFVRGIHRSPVNSPNKDQWRRALLISLICAWTKGWVNSSDAGDFRRRRAHYIVTVMLCAINGMVCILRGYISYCIFMQQETRRP